MAQVRGRNETKQDTQRRKLERWATQTPSKPSLLGVRESQRDSQERQSKDICNIEHTKGVIEEISDAMANAKQVKQ